MTRLVPTAACPETLLQTGLSLLAGCPSPLFEEIMKHSQPLTCPLTCPPTGASPLTLQSSPTSGSSPGWKRLLVRYWPASERGRPLHEGVYAPRSGPSIEDLILTTGEVP